MYKNYSNPISFLNVGYETVGITETVLRVYIDKNNSQLWDLYLHFKPKKSFIDWKQSIGCNSIENIRNGKSYGTKNEQETQKIIDSSNNILKKFSPKRREKGR